MAGIAITSFLCALPPPLPTSNESYEATNMTALDPNHDVVCLAMSENQDNERSFHLFPRLAPELRIMVWEMAFPALGLPSRIFSFKLQESSHGNENIQNDSKGTVRETYELWSEKVLRAQSLPFRQLLAISHETQALLQRSLPDVLSFWHEDVPLFYNLRGNARRSGVRRPIRYRKETDIIYLEERPNDIPWGEAALWSVSFSDQLHNIGWTMDFIGYQNMDNDKMYNEDMENEFLFLGQCARELPNLQKVYCGAKHMDMDCPGTHEDLCNLVGYVQYGVFRYPTTNAFRIAQVDPSFEKLVEPLSGVVNMYGCTFLPLLQKNNGLYSTAQDQGDLEMQSQHVR